MNDGALSPVPDARVALHQWLSVWVEVARLNLPQRADRILLGITRPREGKKTKEPRRAA
jgi:hypothetical protein